MTLAHGDGANPPLVSKSSDLFGPIFAAALLKNIVINVLNIFVHEKPLLLSWIWFVWISSSMSSKATFFTAFDFSANFRSSSY